MTATAIRQAAAVPSPWDLMEERLKSAEQSHREALSQQQECQQAAQQAQQAATTANSIAQAALSDVERWSHYAKQKAALIESMDHLAAKQQGLEDQARLLQEQIRAAYAQADQAQADPDAICAAVLVEKAELVEREHQHRIDLLVRQAAEAAAKLDRERERLDALGREMEKALMDEKD